METGSGHQMASTRKGNIFRQTIEFCPCFFDNLSRTDAARYCLLKGISDTFLMRSSGKNKKFYAITFNCRGNIKHLKLEADDDGKCSVEQFKFDNIFLLLQHFHQQAIPFQSQDEMLLLKNFVCRDNPKNLPKPLTMQSIAEWKLKAFQEIYGLN
ncbi:SH2B adapter protein 1 [Trichoplax sp. H2]|nr:SH2B adapter protein 1 [Trichoplax sp. H2]|eukprot:RDD38037.1 SH2B adapter protein 1 [Trichoplax sp. H2]